LAVAIKWRLSQPIPASVWSRGNSVWPSCDLRRNSFVSASGFADCAAYDDEQRGVAVCSSRRRKSKLLFDNAQRVQRLRSRWSGHAESKLTLPRSQVVAALAEGVRQDFTLIRSGRREGGPHRRCVTQRFDSADAENCRSRKNNPQNGFHA
jgi:hypothetical protein